MKQKLSKFIYGIASLLLLVSCDNACEVAQPESGTDQNLVISYKISEDDARKELLSLMSDLEKGGSRGFSNSRNISNSFTIHVANSKTRGESEEGDSLSIYVFNFDNDEGFAIMSGDNRLPSLIALAENGNITEEEEIEDEGIGLFPFCKRGHVK